MCFIGRRVIVYRFFLDLGRESRRLFKWRAVCFTRCCCRFFFCQYHGRYNRWWGGSGGVGRGNNYCMTCSGKTTFFRWSCCRWWWWWFGLHHSLHFFLRETCCSGVLSCLVTVDFTTSRAGTGVSLGEQLRTSRAKRRVKLVIPGEQERFSLIFHLLLSLETGMAHLGSGQKREEKDERRERQERRAMKKRMVKGRYLEKKRQQVTSPEATPGIQSGRFIQKTTCWWRWWEKTFLLFHQLLWGSNHRMLCLAYPAFFFPPLCLHPESFWELKEVLSLSLSFLFSLPPEAWSINFLLTWKVFVEVHRLESSSLSLFSSSLLFSSLWILLLLRFLLPSSSSSLLLKSDCLSYLEREMITVSVWIPFTQLTMTAFLSLPSFLPSFLYVPQFLTWNSLQTSQLPSSIVSICSLSWETEGCSVSEGKKSVQLRQEDEEEEEIDQRQTIQSIDFSSLSLFHASLCVLFIRNHERRSLISFHAWFQDLTHSDCDSRTGNRSLCWRIQDFFHSLCQWLILDML